MSRSISFLAIAALLSSSIVACADTDQPDKYEAFGGSSGSATSTSDLTSSTATSTADESTAAAAAPKTEEELAKDDAAELSNHGSKSKDRDSKRPLVGN